MDYKELKKQWAAYQKEMPAKLIGVCGTDLPDLPLCSNFIQLTGREISLNSFPGSFEVQSEEYWKARDALQILRTDLHEAEEKIQPDAAALSQAEHQKSMIAMRTELFKQFYDKLTQAYINLMTIEAALGCVRVPVRRYHLHQDTKVPSRYGDWEINYSPVMNEAMLTGAHAIEETARLFATSYIQQEPCSVITVKFNKTVHPHDYFKVQSIIAEFCETFNAYARDEFEEKKDNEEYQHRRDDDPAAY